jgi:hypothetical protein
VRPLARDESAVFLLYLPTVYLFLSRLFAQTMHRDWIMLTDSPTGIVNVQPILEAIWLFLLGSCGVWQTPLLLRHPYFLTFLLQKFA